MRLKVNISKYKDFILRKVVPRT